MIERDTFFIIGIQLLALGYFGMIMYELGAATNRFLRNAFRQPERERDVTLDLEGRS